MVAARRFSSWQLTTPLLGFLLLGLSFSLPARVSAQESTFAVSIVSPAEGETLYAGPTTLLYTIDVRGWVIGATDPAQVSVQLEVFKDDMLEFSMLDSPGPDGAYAFPVTVNPEGSVGDFTPVQVEAFCEDCHYAAANSFPNGALLLRVTATDSDGRQTTSERHIVVDRSAYTTVPVQVMYTGNPGQAMAGITVTASTWIYEWRARHDYAKTDETGIAYLTLEALSQGPTHYLVQAESSVQDGVFYEGVEPLQVTIPASGGMSNPIMLEIHQTLGTIGGQIRFVRSKVPLPLELWAVRVRDEAGYRASVNEFGRFTFTDLPLGRYIITADPDQLGELGWGVEHQMVELTTAPEAGIKLKATALEGLHVVGRLLDSNGGFIPFGRVAIEDSSLGADVLPSTAAWSLYSAPEAPFTLTATAPGFLRAEVEIDPGSSDPNALRLEMALETRVLDWGEGRIVLPSETRATVKDGAIQLDYGWLWGAGGGETPIYIQLPNADLTVNGGSFALEIAPGQINRLFMYEGSAQVISRATRLKSELTAGKMIDLTDLDRSIPVLQNPVVDMVIQAEYGIDMPQTYAPGELTEQRTLLQNAAGIITLITYYLIFLVLGALPLVLIYSWLRRRIGRKRD